MNPPTTGIRVMNPARHAGRRQYAPAHTVVPIRIGVCGWTTFGFFAFGSGSGAATGRAQPVTTSLHASEQNRVGGAPTGRHIRPRSALCRIRLIALVIVTHVVTHARHAGFPHRPDRNIFGARPGYSSTRSVTGNRGFHSSNSVDPTAFTGGWSRAA
jgi:hypothetical protein